MNVPAHWLAGPVAVVAALSMVVLSACESPPTQQQAGTVLGGVVGGVVGAEIGDHRTAATIIGAIVGATIGSAIGRTMDEQDRRRAGYVLEATPTGQTGYWVNPDTGHRFNMTPTRTYTREGAPCREFTIDATIGGRLDQVYGTACRQPDGAWRILR